MKLEELRQSTSVRAAIVFQRAHNTKVRFLQLVYRNPGLKRSAIALLAGASIVATLFAAAMLVDDYFHGLDRYSDLQNLLRDTGTAFVGAAAIAFSVVLFAMQINVERMPHGLFSRLSSDRRLIGFFFSAVALAVGISASSLAPTYRWAAVTITWALWSIIGILALFALAYRRALKLISPIEQLSIVVADARKDLARWDRRATRMIPLLIAANARDANKEPLPSDSARTLFFMSNRSWTEQTSKAIRYAASYSRRYAEVGDGDVLHSANLALVHINAAYIAAKGRTFYGSNLLIENPLVTDEIINESLEGVRRNLEWGISRRDEQQIMAALRAFAGLAGVYLHIDYSQPDSSKTHAHLASGYLESAVETLIPHRMPDVVMVGVRLIGDVSLNIVKLAGANEVVATVDKLGFIASQGAASKEMHPVTLTAFEQLSELSLMLLVGPSHEIRYPVDRLRASINEAATIFMHIPEVGLSGTHRHYLAPYFSSTSENSFRFKAVQLVNSVMRGQADDETVQRVIRHFIEWADGLNQSHKELLLIAVRRQSSLAFEMISFSKDVAEWLLVLASSTACNAQDRAELDNLAFRMVAILSWVPASPETAHFLEGFSFTDLLFESVELGFSHESDAVEERAKETLLAWTFAAGRYENGWGILQQGLIGLAIWALLRDPGVRSERLVQEIRTILARPETRPERDLLERTAEELRRIADAPYRNRFEHRSIRRALGQVDAPAISGLLGRIAETLIA